MDDQSRRKELRAQYKQARPEAGVYRILNSRNHKVLVGSTPNLPSLRHKLEFAQSTKTATVLDRRLAKDTREFGIEAFSLEVLEILDVTPETTQAQILEDLATLEELWREKQDPALLY
jgi:hypothetical protein